MENTTNHYVRVYGRKIKIRVRTKKQNHKDLFYYGSIGFNPRWIAVSNNKINLINKIYDRLSIVFEKCALQNDFSKWNRLVS